MPEYPLKISTAQNLLLEKKYILNLHIAVLLFFSEMILNNVTINSLTCQSGDYIPYICEKAMLTWSLLLLLRRAPRALEGGHSERQHLLGVGREDFEWGRRTTKGVLREDIEIWASLQPMF